ncbi:MAG: hypothetical protein GOU97_04515 [Nanoarchaeota archaeon]|nr:hypothetical protein [Nanoarchaeota archaeon]
MKKAQLSIEFFTTISFLIMILITVLIIFFQRSTSLNDMSKSDNLKISCQELRTSFYSLMKSNNLIENLSLPNYSGGIPYSYHAHPSESVVVIGLDDKSFICNVQTTGFTNSSMTEHDFFINPSGTAKSVDEVIVFE